MEIRCFYLFFFRLLCGDWRQRHKSPWNEKKKHVHIQFIINSMMICDVQQKLIGKQKNEHVIQFNLRLSILYICVCVYQCVENRRFSVDLNWSYKLANGITVFAIFLHQLPLIIKLIHVWTHTLNGDLYWIHTTHRTFLILVV